MESSTVLTKELLTAKIHEALLNYQDPYLKVDLLQAGCIQDLIIDGRLVKVVVEFGFLHLDHVAKTKEILHNLLNPIINDLAAQVGIRITLEVQVGARVISHACKPQLTKIPNIKNIIAIGSGKGGVGKSTVAINLALALQQHGAKVGILDADLYGPSIPQMLNCTQKVVIRDHKFQPQLAYGLVCISIGHLLDQDSPAMWRGPMASGGLLQLLYDTMWPELDYLLVDLPPGTGDIQITLAQKIPVTGVVIVTTPQQVAVLDAQKALQMFNKLDLKILGIIENMSSFACPKCNCVYDLFGTAGGQELVKKYKLKLLGKIPIDLKIRQQADLGIPLGLVEPESDSNVNYQRIATCMAAALSILPLDSNIAIEVQ